MAYEWNGGELNLQANLEGRSVGTLSVGQKAGNNRWHVQCQRCKASGTESHALLAAGRALCRAGGCRDNAEAVRAAQAETLPKARSKAAADDNADRRAAEDKAEAARRAVEAEFADGHQQLAKLIRDRIAGQRDDECFVDQATLAVRMTQADADAFNSAEAAKYAASNPAFYPSRANRLALGGYFARNGINIVSAATLGAAVRRLSEYGLLPESRPAPLPEALPHLPAYVNLSIEPEPEQPAVEPEGMGWDIETGEPRFYSPLQIERMSIETYRRAFRVRREEQILNRRRW